MSNNKKSQKHGAEDNLDDAALQTKLHEMQFTKAIDTKVLRRHPNPTGDGTYEHTTSKGHTLVIQPGRYIKRAEIEMMRYAFSHGVPAPHVRGFYEVMTTHSRPLTKVIVSDRLPGARLADIYQTFNKAETKAIITQLRDILVKMRTNTEPFIGRPGKKPIINPYTSVIGKLMGPFDDEDGLDDWFYERLPPGWFNHWKRFFASERKRRVVAKEKGGVSPRFVLTHGNLRPCNILVQGTTITGIVDWERSGFLPDWAEFVFAWMSCNSNTGDKWWAGWLKELSLPIDKHRKDIARELQDLYDWSSID